ncbi:MAG TPA: lysyl oxidase family protein [Polyangiaceae bacterium]|nr:lysyl oxidase family protein [Polyangiaceae bacterium]
MWSRSLCAALLSAGLAACLPAFDPDLDASRLGDAELQLCGTQGGACCAAPASACDDELVCDNNRQLCMRQPVLLCDSDAECGGGEVCCPSGFVGTCTRGAKEDCPALDLIVATPQLDFDAVDLRYFDPDVESDRCLIERGCVGGEGWRRLLGVSTVVSNVDGADLLLGSPTDSAESTTTCRGEARFASFLRYELVDSNGTKAQQDIAAACAPASTGQFIAPFDCDFQGIWSGYSQAYVSSLSEGGSADDCRWLDITGLLPGDYTLRVTVDPKGYLSEKNLDNNTPAELPLSLPSFDPQAPCAEPADPFEGRGAERECGWVRDGFPADERSTTCAPGERLFLTCQGNDPANLCGEYRVCDGPDACTYETAIARSEAGCFPAYEANIDVTCPGSGQFSFWVPSNNPDGFRCERPGLDESDAEPEVTPPAEP